MTEPPGGWSGATPVGPQEGGWPQQPPAPPGSWPQQPPAPPGSWQQQPPAPPGGWPRQPAEQVVWGAPSSAPGVGSWESLGAAGDSAHRPRGRGRGKLFATIAVVAALAAGGTATYLALSGQNSQGAASAIGAVQSIVDSLNKSDLIGALDDLPPGERDALSAPLQQQISQLKRLGVLKPKADPSNLDAVTFQLRNLTFGRTVNVNDHVQLVQLTGGTLDVSADASKIPFTSQFVQAAFPHGLPASSHGTRHLDIGQRVRASGRPVQLAAQRVGGRWYPSLFYTVAAAAARDSGRTLTAADYIPAVGASSPQNAVSQEIRALLAGDYPAAIKLLSPDELAVLHDYGGLIAQRPGRGGPSPVSLQDLQLTTTAISGGAVRVGLRSATVVFGSGSGTHQLVISAAGGCYELTVDAMHRRMCTPELVSALTAQLDKLGPGASVTPEQRQALTDLVGGLANVGVVTTQSGGTWYVNPVRSYLELSTSVLSALKGSDLLVLVRYFSGAGR